VLGGAAYADAADQGWAGSSPSLLFRVLENSQKELDAIMKYIEEATEMDMAKGEETRHPQPSLLFNFS
jgi:hypothetical protein